MLRYFLVLLSLTLFSWWLATLVEPEKAFSRPKRTGVDYYASRITRIETYPDGRPKLFLAAALLTHYAEDDRTLLHQPVLLWHAEAGKDIPPWEIRAETATVSEDGKSLFLEGVVLLRREAFQDHAPLSVISRNVTVRPEEKYAETKELVEIFNHPQYTRGVGMQASFQDGLKITLLSQVRDIHE